MAPRQFARRLAASVAFALAAVAFFSAAPSQRAGSQTPPPAGFQWQELGARVFGANCSVCHQENGQGIAGAFPPLAGHVAELFAQQSGRDYLVRLVLFGLEGTISAKGSSYSSAMPPWPQLTDSEIAAALDYVLSAWGNDKLLPRDFTLILPSDVAAARGQQMSAVDVHALRGRIVTDDAGRRGGPGDDSVDIHCRAGGARPGDL